MIKQPLIKPSAKRVQVNPASTSRLVTDAVFIAGLTAAAYVFAYLFEMGYCRHFGIPFYLITATPTSVIFALISVAMVLTLAIQAYGIAEFLFKEFGLSRLGFRVAQWLLYAAVSVALYGWSVDTISAMVTITILVFADYAVLVPTGKEPLLERIRVAEKAPVPVPKIDPLARTLVKGGRVPILVFNFIVLGAILSFGVGAASARLQTEFAEQKAIPNSLVVRGYGDLLISIKFDPATKTATGETTIAKISDTPTALHVKTKVGPIQRPAALLVR